MITALDEHQIHTLQLIGHIQQGCPLFGLPLDEVAVRRNHGYALGPSLLEPPAVFAFYIHIKAMAVALHDACPDTCRPQLRNQPFNERRLAGIRHRCRYRNERHRPVPVGEPPPDQPQIRRRIHIEERLSRRQLHQLVRSLCQYRADLPLPAGKCRSKCPHQIPMIERGQRLTPPVGLSHQCQRSICRCQQWSCRRKCE